MLEARSVSVRYGDRLVLDGVSLAVERGERLALLGPNGAGKTTLLRVFGGLLPASSGGVSLEGRALAAWPARERARKLAGIPQDPEAPIPLRVSDVVKTGRLPHAGDWNAFGPADREAIADALHAMDMTDKADRFLHELSAGERQRAWLAMALAQRADILLLDEPTAHLDIRHAWHLMELLSAWAGQRGLTVLLSTHDFNLAAAFSSRVALLAGGRLDAVGPPMDVMTSERLCRVFEHPLDVQTRNGPPMIVPRRGSV